MKWLKKFNDCNIGDTILVGLFNSTLKEKIKGKIAGFDLDHTLICPKTKKTFPDKKDPTDWKFMYDNVKKKLTKLNDNGYTIIIVTNQKGLKKQDEINVWKERINNMLTKLDLPIIIMCSLSSDMYRKPLTGFFDMCVNKMKKNSFYCGDAFQKKRITDYTFALNLGIKFKTPEEVFTNETVSIPKIKYCFPIDKHCKIIPYEDTNNKILDSIYGIGIPYDDVYKNIKKYIENKKKVLIINVGYPACGKSFFSNIILKKLKPKIINRDLLKSIPKCIKKAKEYIKNKEKLVIIDNTNVSKDDRKIWLELFGDNHNYTTICAEFTTPIDLCQHNNMYRIQTRGRASGGLQTFNKTVKHIPEIAYRIMKKKYIKPKLNEGFDKKYEIQFCPKLDDEQVKKYYSFK